MACGLNTPDMEAYVLPLRRLLGELKPKTVLEIGIGYDAYSTQVWLEDGNVRLTTIDKEDWGGWGLRLQQTFPVRYTFLRGFSQAVLPTLADPYDLIYIDGDHAYEGVKADILACMELVTNGVILLDDYGVERSALDIVDGRVVEGDFGIKQAADELFDNRWERVYQHLDFGNGGAAYRRKHEA